MEQHLTVREACEFTGKSESAMKRLIREIASSPKHADRALILPPPEEVERRKKSGDVFVWKINQELLTRRFPKQSASEEGSVGTDKTSGPGGDLLGGVRITISTEGSGVCATIFQVINCRESLPQAKAISNLRYAKVSSFNLLLEQRTRASARCR